MPPISARRLYLRDRGRCRIRSAFHRCHRRRRLDRRGRTLRCAGVARLGAWFPDDYARTGPDRVGLAYRANDITGGDNGIRYPARPMPFGVDITSAPQFYYFTLIVFAVALFCIWRLTRSPFGAAWQGTRDQPRRMRMLGHNVWLIRWFAFVHVRVLGLDRGPPLRLLQPFHQRRTRSRCSSRPRSC